MFELEEHFPRFWHQQHTLVFTIGEIFGANSLRVAVAEIDFAANGFGNAGRERHLHAAILFSVFVGADATHVSRVRNHAPGIMLKLFPLLQKIIATMISNLADE